jgi:SDR family mycofactocin-dependent oxidoreductase
MDKGLKGKVAFITGAARGQGRSHAVRLADEGVDVVICDSCAPIAAANYAMPSVEDLEHTAKLVEEKDRRVIARQVDVRDLDGLEALVEEARQQFGRLDFVLANAGIASYGGALELTEETWREVVDINMTGVWHTVRATTPLMIDGGNGGAIVLTSSAAGAIGLPGLVHYVSAKHGVVGMTKALANEFGQHNIRVNSILPGTVNTDMAANGATYKLFRPDLENPTFEDCEEIMRGLMLLPIAWVEASDITNAAVWLCSDEARYVTGVALPVDAGYITKTF